jgi:transposase
VHAWFSRWRTDGTWDRVLDSLRAQVRNRHGRADQPTAAILDSQSVPNAGPADQVGYDAGKAIRG